LLQVEVRWSAKCVDKPPNAKHAKLSLTRFSTPQSDEEMTEIYKGKQICEYTEKYSMGNETVQRMDQ